MDSVESIVLYKSLHSIKFESFVNDVDKIGILNQINQLERDKDVVAQAQAIATLEALPQLSFSVVNALNNFLSDSKVLILSEVQFLSMHWCLVICNFKISSMFSRPFGESELRQHLHWLIQHPRYYNRSPFH